MKNLKKAMIFFSLAVAALFIYFSLGSIDLAEAPQVETVTPIDDATNGYLRIAYVEKLDTVFDSTQRENHKRILTTKTWDPSAASLISRYSKEIYDYLDVAKHPNFLITPKEDPSQFPSYINIIDIGRLALIKSRMAAESGMLDEAVDLASNAATVATLVKLDKNETLISFMIGIAMQNEALRWMDALSHNYALTADHQRKLLHALYSLPAFSEDGFKQVFYGEYRFAAALTANIFDASLKERLMTYWNKEDYWNHDLDADFEFDRENIKKELYSLLSALFPRFYIHRNKNLQKLFINYEAFAAQTAHYCNKVTKTHEAKEFSGLTWLMLIEPNSTQQLWDQGQQPQFYDYFIRRCLSQAHLEATKLLIALRLFRADNGHYPVALDSLLPNYLESVPIDPFDGAPLRYSTQDAWIYSVGENFQDDGGSAKACIKHPCRQGENCLQNPTFPIDSRVCSIENLE